MSLKVRKYRFTLTFTEPLLGAVPKDEDTYWNYIAPKAEGVATEDLEDEAEDLPEVDEDEEQGVTGFLTDKKGPYLMDYVIKGFMKSACGALRRVSGTHSKKLRAYKKVINELVFVDPRKIHLQLPEGKGLGRLARSLRASTPQGERIAIARSDTAPVGTVIEFTLKVIGDALSEDLIFEWFDYGEFLGIGQWRNGSYGRFVHVAAKDSFD